MRRCSRLFGLRPSLDQMQADLASVGHGACKLSIFIATLGRSRAAYVEFCDDERVETLIECHEHAFLAFAGVPREVLFDNMKTVVIERNRLWTRRAPFPCGLFGLRAACGFCAAPLSALSRSDEGQGRALYRLSEAQLLGAVRSLHAPGRLEPRQACRQCGGRPVEPRARGEHIEPFT